MAMTILKTSLTATTSITEIPISIGTAPLTKKNSKIMSTGLTMNLMGRNVGRIAELQNTHGD